MTVAEGYGGGVWDGDGEEPELLSQSSTETGSVHLAWLHSEGGGGAPGNLPLRGDPNGHVPQHTHRCGPTEAWQGATGGTRATSELPLPISLYRLLSTHILAIHVHITCGGVCVHR